MYSVIKSSKLPKANCANIRSIAIVRQLLASFLKKTHSCPQSRSAIKNTPKKSSWDSLRYILILPKASLKLRKVIQQIYLQYHLRKKWRKSLGRSKRNILCIWARKSVAYAWRVSYDFILLLFCHLIFFFFFPNILSYLPTLFRKSRF